MNINLQKKTMDKEKLTRIDFWKKLSRLKITSRKIRLMPALACLQLAIFIFYEGFLIQTVLHLVLFFIFSNS